MIGLLIIFRNDTFLISSMVSQLALHEVIACMAKAFINMVHAFHIWW